jgi:hypothetical protein
VQNIRQESALKVAQVERALTNQKRRYTELNKPVSRVLTAAVDDLNSAQSKVTQLLDTRNGDLVKAKQRRQEYHSSLEIVKQWLDDTEEKLSAPIAPTAEEFAKHEVMQRK